MPARHPWWVASILAHAALVAAALWFAGREARPPEPLPAPSVEIVFEGGQPERAEAEPPPGVEVPPAPPAPPQPPMPPAPPAVAALPPPPLPTPPVIPVPVPLPPEPPRAVAEDARMPPLPPVAELVLPPPPEMRLHERVEVPPAPPVPPAAPVPSQRQAAPAFPPGTVFLPGGVQLGRPAPPAGRPNARGLDLTVDPRLAEGNFSADPTVRVSGAQVGADWRAAFRRWLDQNLRYPTRAIELGESGTVRVQVIAEPDGRVRSVRLVGPSTSPSLNLGTTFPFRGAQLPAFPPPADPNGITVDLTVNYILIRR